MSASSVAKAGSMEGHWFDGSNKLSKPSCSFCAIAYIMISATFGNRCEQEILQRRIAVAQARAGRRRGPGLSSVGWLRTGRPRTACSGPVWSSSPWPVDHIASVEHPAPSLPLACIRSGVRHPG